MAKKTDVGIQFTAKDKASKTVEGLESKISNFAKKTGSDIKNTFAPAMLAAGGVVAGVGIAIKQGLDAAKYAADVEQVKMSFQSIAKESGVVADEVIDNMRRLSGETVSELDLMLAASRANLLGLPMDELDNLMQIARASATATGGSVQQLFNDIVVGIGRASPLILDNLGITVKIGQANEDYAKSIGKTVSKLTDQEKKQALLNAVLDKGQDIIRKVGEAGQMVTASERFQQLQARMSDLTAEIGAKVLPIVLEFIEGIKDLTEGIGPLIDILMLGLQPVLQAAADLIKGFGEGIKEITDAIDKAYAVDVARKEAEFRSMVEEMTEGFNGEKIVRRIETEIAPALKKMYMDVVNSIASGVESQITSQEKLVAGYQTVVDVLNEILGDEEKRAVLGDVQLKTLQMYFQLWGPTLEREKQSLENVRERVMLERELADRLFAFEKEYIKLDSRVMDLARAWDDLDTVQQKGWNNSISAYSQIVEELQKQLGITDVIRGKSALMGEVLEWQRSLTIKIANIKDGIVDSTQEELRQLKEQLDTINKLKARLEALPGVEIDLKMPSFSTDFLQEMNRIRDQFLTQEERELQKIGQQMSYLQEFKGLFGENIDRQIEEILMQLRQKVENMTIPEMADKTEFEKALEEVGEMPLFAMFEDLESVIDSFGAGIVRAVAAIEPLSKVLNFTTVIIDGIVKVIKPILETVLRPLIGIFSILGQTLGKMILPLIQVLGPVLELLGKGFVWLYNNAILPFGNVIITVFNIIYNIVAVIVNAIAEAVNFLLGWLGVHMEGMAYRGLEEGYLTPISYEMLLTEGGEAIEETGTAGTGATETSDEIYGGDTTVQRQPDIYIYQYFQGPIVGPEGIAEFGEMTADALREYAGIGGLIHIEEAIAPIEE